MWFTVPDNYSGKTIDVDGIPMVEVSAWWFTNLDFAKRHQKYIFRKHYSPEEYPTYDNYDAINVNKVSEIPCDYDGVMGVPITYLAKHNPDQFEILEMSGSLQVGEAFIKEYRRQGGTGHYSANAHGIWYFDNKGKVKVPYRRIFIRRKDA